RLERAALADSSGAFFDELAKRYVHRGLVHAWPADVAADAVQLRTAVLLRTQADVPLGAVLENQRNVAQRLDVIDGGRRAVQPHHRRKRRLVARLGALAFKRLEERRLFARLVGAGAAVHVDVAGKIRPEDLRAEKALFVRLGNRALQHALNVK